MKNIDGIIVADFSEADNSMGVYDNIAQNTVNTWQRGRSAEEKKRDTEQGKIAESIVEKFIHENTNLRYISYDQVRNDSFKKHAPCDGFLLSQRCSDENLNRFVEMVHDSIQHSRGIAVVFGPDIRAFAKQNHIYFVEIKSTKVNKTKRNKAHFTGYENEQNIKPLINQIMADDYLTYPHYTRSGDINSTEEYIEYLVQYGKIESSLTQQEKTEEFIKTEREAALSDIFVRVYLDYDHLKVLIIGYITKEDFIDENVKIKKMIKWGKSQNAIYLAKNLRFGSYISNLSVD